MRAGVFAVLAVVFATAAIAEPIELFNGKDFEGWKLFIPDENVDPLSVWSINDGVIRCAGSPKGYMRTTTAYQNYKVSVEWRWPEDGGNNGLLVHIAGEDQVWPKSIECQLQHENAGDFWVIGGAEFAEHVDKSTRRVIKKTDHNEKPLGEWNTMEAVCEGNTIKVYVNGLLQNEATDCTLTEGFIGLQSEGTPIEYRNIVLEPLEESKE
jgi:3-keto-disaccharide hydrolase